MAMGVLLGVAGCNVISFFPHKAAEKAADEVLDDILPGNGANEKAAQVDAALSSVPAEPKQP